MYLTLEPFHQVLLQGRLASGDPSPVLSFHQRAGNKFAGKPGLTWHVYGDKAELLIEIEAGSPHIGAKTKLYISDGATGEVEEVPVEQEFEGLKMPAANIGRLFEAYAADVNGGKKGGYADWEEALRMHEIIEEAYKSNGY